jgi:hypothetical protein
MEWHQFDALAARIAWGGTRREVLQRLGLAALGIGSLSLVGSAADARRRKKHKKRRGDGGGNLGLFAICDPANDACQAGLKCDSPTTRHTCSSTVEGVDTWCCVPPGGRCTECECCGDYYCDFGDANPDGACIRNPED